MMTDTRDEQAEDGTRADPSVLVRYPTAFALGGGLAAAVGSSFIPMNAIEGFVSAYGIAELLPAAAPPLGQTARLALSTGIGTLTAGALLALLPREDNTTMGFETSVHKDPAQDVDTDDAARPAGGFGVSRVAGWVRTLRFGKTEPDENEVTDFADLNRFRVRNGDQHPDAPVRAPILASSDLGAPLDDLEAEDGPSPVVPDGTASLEDDTLALDSSMAFTPEKPVAPVAAPSLRFAPPPEVSKPIDAAQDPSSDSEMMASTEAFAEPMQPDQADQGPDLARLSIPALLERLEQGLARRRELARDHKSGPVEAHQPEGRVIPLAVASSPAAAEGYTAADEQPAPSRRFGIGRPIGSFQSDSAAISKVPEATSESDIGAMATGPAYQPADVTDRLDTDGDQGEGAGEADTPETPEAAADDDMDAALRDALATLRQLSDRQRNV